MKKRIISILLTAAIAVGVLFAGITYVRFISHTIYAESTAHLKEIYHQADQTLYNLVSVNWSRMRLWVPYLETADSEDDIDSFVNQAREETHFSNFYFISRDGEYLTLDGKNGYLDLREKLSDIMPGEQREWDREYTHQKTGEKRWFRVSVFCSDIQGEKKYILDLSD